MKAEHILLLVLAGALVGAGLMKVVQRPQPAPAVASVAPTVSTPPAPVVPRVAAQPVQAPAVPPVAAEEPIEQVPLPPVRHAAAVDRAPRPMRSAPAHVHGFSVKPSPFSAAREMPAIAKIETAKIETPKAVPQQPQPPQTVTPPPAASPASVEPAPAPAAPAPPPPPTVTLNSGMLIPVRLVAGLSSDHAAPGDTFAATLDHELVADGFVIAERGARVEGRVVAASRGALTIELTRLDTSDGQHPAIRTERFEKRVEPDRREDAEKIAGGAAIGAAIGAIAGGGKGAAIGAGVGGGAGAGDVMLTRKPATLTSETRISFRLSAPVTLTERR
jgi:hypothetical protein